MKKIILAAIVAIFATAANAQELKLNAKADSSMHSGYGKNAYMVVRHGNNGWHASANGIYDIVDKKAGASVKLSRFIYGHSIGIEGNYLEKRSSFNAFYKYRLGKPSTVYCTIGAGAGMTEQWGITGSAGDISGDVTGSYMMLLGTSKLQFSCYGEIELGVRLGKRIDLIAGVRGVYLPSEGKYTDAANELILNSGGKPLQVVQKSGAEYKELLVKDLKSFHPQFSLGISIWF